MDKKIFKGYQGVHPTLVEPVYESKIYDEKSKSLNHSFKKKS
jgi:hypothetical protein